MNLVLVCERICCGCSLLGCERKKNRTQKFTENSQKLNKYSNHHTRPQRITPLRKHRTPIQHMEHLPNPALNNSSLAMSQNQKPKVPFLGFRILLWFGPFKMPTVSVHRVPTGFFDPHDFMPKTLDVRSSNGATKPKPLLKTKQHQTINQTKPNKRQSQTD